MWKQISIGGSRKKHARALENKGKKRGGDLVKLAEQLLRLSCACLRTNDCDNNNHENRAVNDILGVANRLTPKFIMPESAHPFILCLFDESSSPVQGPGMPLWVSEAWPGQGHKHAW